VKRLLMNCDQVFEVLTRGPFPTGEPGDRDVEHHLRACHDCRQLAEALRPAVALLHEAIAADGAMDLPGYQGSLPDERLAKSAARKRNRHLPAPLTAASRGERRQPQAISAVRLVAASLLFAALGLLIGSTILSPASKQRLAKAGEGLLPASDSAAAREAAEGIPSEKGLLTLASLKLPMVCLPLTHRPLSIERAGEIVAALSDGTLDALHCCTECHHAGGEPTHSLQLAATIERNCQDCHRG
jgi:hypothetical protein